MSDKNVTLPLDLMKKIIYVLELIDMSSYDPAAQGDYIHILFCLNKKLRTLDLRSAYTKMVTAYDEETRKKAKMQYLKKKYEFNN